VGTWINHPNASGDSASTVLGESLFQQVGSMNEESPLMKGRRVSNTGQLCIRWDSGFLTL
jgi:hypothetical protein